MPSLHFLPFLALALVVVAPQAHAQVQFGIRAGLNVSNLAGDDASDTEARLGFLGGLTATYSLPSGLYVQPEVLYSQKGANEADDGGTYSIGYIDVPIFLGYSLPTATNLLARLYAGPQLSVKVNDSVRFEAIGADFDIVKDTDFSLAFGADVGARRANRMSEFGVGLRYALGLTDIFDVEGLGDLALEAAPSVRNRVLSVTAFYRF